MGLAIQQCGRARVSLSPLIFNGGAAVIVVGGCLPVRSVSSPKEGEERGGKGREQETT